MESPEEFRAYRAEMNEKILSADNKVLKRIFGVDTLAFDKGELDKKTKELIGLSCSLVLRCDDCVKYHLEACKKAGLTDKEVIDAMSIANLIGGTIVIPHLRRAFDFLEALSKEETEGDA
ncbi:carboxymuconolactone decarboxylase family protein [Flammeovirgaceae bacterium SG7u.111]|nr:carboxymuconolactone decarboxylase family protein [Flammeovirgaceae bacterium SG7u.132]WPO35516.1 carboxymuconolactone decarboxylase family protein [Flammeovirgaceae bacterium SG7u.111]